MLTSLRYLLYSKLNRFLRRNGPTLNDQITTLIMHMCALQLEREEVRELAPIQGTFGNIQISGGAITKIQYSVFDRHADKLDKEIRKEPWRAFSQVTVYLSVNKAPEFKVVTDNQEVEPKSIHTDPAYKLIQALSLYFPLIPKPYVGPIIKPVEEVSS